MEYVPPSLKNKEICRNWGKCLKCLTHFKLTHLSSVSKTQSYSLNCMKKKITKRNPTYSTKDLVLRLSHTLESPEKY